MVRRYVAEQVLVAQGNAFDNADHAKARILGQRAIVVLHSTDHGLRMVQHWFDPYLNQLYLAHRIGPRRICQEPGMDLIGSVRVDEGQWFNPAMPISDWDVQKWGMQEIYARKVEAYERLLCGCRGWIIERARKELKDKNLVCTCPMTVACHADVLLYAANYEKRK